MENGTIIFIVILVILVLSATCSACIEKIKLYRRRKNRKLKFNQRLRTTSVLSENTRFKCVDHSGYNIQEMEDISRLRRAIRRSMPDENKKLVDKAYVHVSYSTPVAHENQLQVDGVQCPYQNDDEKTPLFAIPIKR